MEQDFLDSMRQIIKEEISPLEKKIDKNTEAISVMSKKVDRNTEAISAMSKKVDRNTEAISVMSKKVDRNTEAISTINKQLDENSLVLKALEENKDYRNSQMDKLINDVAEVQGSIKSLENSFNNHSHQAKTEIGKVKVS